MNLIMVPEVTLIILNYNLLLLIHYLGYFNTTYTAREQFLMHQQKLSTDKILTINTSYPHVS